MTSQEEEKVASVLLQHMRNASGKPDLQYKEPPKALSGGLSGGAIYGFELDCSDEAYCGAKVLRASVSHTERERIREISLQDAANRIDNLSPAVRLVQRDELFEGVFFVMDRLPGGSLWRWYFMLVGISIIFAIMMSQVLVVVLGYLLGVTAVGIAMAKQKQLLQAIPVSEIKGIYSEYGVQHAEAGSSYWLGLAAQAIEDAGLIGYQPGLGWMEEHAFEPSRPGLCLGDFHPSNCIVTWTQVTGLIDWEMACIADPELDVGALRYLVTLVGPLALPIYWVFRIHLYISEAYNESKVNYYEAQRILFMLCSFTRKWIDYENQLAFAYPVPKPFLRWAMKLMVWTHSRRFLKITGIRLTPPVSLL